MRKEKYELEVQVKKVWVLVANSTITKIYRSEDKKLTLHRTFEHEEGHLKGRDIVSDAAGRNTQRGVYGSDTMEEKTPLRLKEANQFADQLCKFLEEAYKQKEFDHIYVVAKPPFLSNIRHCLSENMSKLIKDEIHKDLTSKTPEEIREYLPPVL